VKALLMSSLTFIIIASPALGKTAEDLPEPPKSAADWAQEWTSSQKSNPPGDRPFALLSRCVVVEKKGNAYKYIEVDPEKAVHSSLMESPEKSSLALSVEINSSIINNENDEDKINPCEKSLSSIAKCYNVDAVLDVTGSKWKLYRYVPKVKKMKMVFERPSGNSSDYFKWMQDQLSFDAVILEQKGDYILTLMPTEKLDKGAQALTIKDSSRLFGLNAATRKGTSLISIEAQTGRYGMFKMVVASPNVKDAFHPGTKIILQKSKQTKMPPNMVEPDKAGPEDKANPEGQDNEEETQE
ncbi:MAG: hypothetical protein WCO71_11785, partial [Pseudomonadota bacterium]